jgi:Uncharacterized proteins of the AP superfamily
MCHSHSVMTRPGICLASLLLIAASASAAGAQIAAAPAKPRLVVLIAIDQFRADYLERFGALPGGLGRISRGGAWFTNAHHDHAITETAPGHATLLSGRFPRSTGIMMNRVGVEDAGAPLIAGGVGTGASPKRFQGTTLVDWVRSADPQSRAFSVSSKDRAAILPVGRSKSEVYWYSTDGRFTTSSYYRDTLPSWVTAWNNRGFPQSFAGRRWDLLLPVTAYPEPDSVEAEGGRAFTFPHILPDDPEAVANLVRGTPFIDDITLSFALHGVQSLALGASPHTDVLSMSLSATDYIGHRYGPDSREIHDQVVRVDRTLGAFLDSLYKLRDSSTITIALTADHGVGTIPELAPASMNSKPVRVTLAPLIAPLREALRTAKVDTLAIDVDQQIIIVDRAAFASASANADSAVASFASAIKALPGVRRVDSFQALAADTLTDPVARRWRHQFPANANIALVVTLTPGSTWAGNIAFHGTPYDYDTHVPIVFYGAGVKPGRIADFVRTVDIAPTLAALARVRPTETLDGGAADGRHSLTVYSALVAESGQWFAWVSGLLLQTSHSPRHHNGLRHLVGRRPRCRRARVARDGQRLWTHRRHRDRYRRGVHRRVDLPPAWRQLADRRVGRGRSSWPSSARSCCCSCFDCCTAAVQSDCRRNVVG